MNLQRAIRVITEATVPLPAAADAFGVAHSTVRTWVHRGQLAVVRIGSTVLVDRNEIARLRAERGLS